MGTQSHGYGKGRKTRGGRHAEVLEEQATSNHVSALNNQQGRWRLDSCCNPARNGKLQQLWEYGVRAQYGGQRGSEADDVNKDHRSERARDPFAEPELVALLGGSLEFTKRHARAE